MRVRDASLLEAARDPKPTYVLQSLRRNRCINGLRGCFFSLRRENPVCCCSKRDATSGLVRAFEPASIVCARAVGVSLMAELAGDADASGLVGELDFFNCGVAATPLPGCVREP